MADRWPISQADRDAAVAAMIEILNSDDWPCAIRAARVLLAMDQANAKFQSLEDATRQRIVEILRSRESN